MKIWFSHSYSTLAAPTRKKRRKFSSCSFCWFWHNEDLRSWGSVYKTLSTSIPIWPKHNPTLWRFSFCNLGGSSFEARRLDYFGLLQLGLVCKDLEFLKYCILRFWKSIKRYVLTTHGWNHVYYYAWFNWCTSSWSCEGFSILYVYISLHYFDIFDYILFFLSMVRTQHPHLSFQARMTHGHYHDSLWSLIESFSTIPTW